MFPENRLYILQSYLIFFWSVPIWAANLRSDPKVYAESTSALPTDQRKQHECTLSFIQTQAHSWQIITHVIPARFYWKKFSFQIFQIASNDNKNTYFRKNTSTCSVQLCQHDFITQLPNFKCDKSSLWHWKEIEYVGKAKHHKRMSLLSNVSKLCIWLEVPQHFPARSSRLRTLLEPHSYPLPKGILRIKQ